MEQVFAEIGSNFQQVGGECPTGWITMDSQRPDDDSIPDYTAQPNGTWAITQDTVNAKLAPLENQWREEQMARIANQLLMIEDDDPAALPGTEREWRDYRIKVRAWKEGNVDFPNSDKRPAYPTEG